MKQRQKSSNLTKTSWMVLALLLVVIVGCSPNSPANLPASDATTTIGNNAQANAAPIARKQVLVINSYHIGYKWTDDVMRGITDVFKSAGGVDLRVEYLDAKRISDEEYLDQVFQLYKDKYQDAHLDLIMSSDDAALNFLFKYADQLFPKVPVVFVGANFFDETRLQGFDRFTGISEEADVAGTLDLALSLHPEVKNIVIVNDTSVTGQNMHRILTELVPQYPKLTFQLLEDVTMDQVRQRVGSLSPDSLVLVTIFFKDKAGGFYEYDQFTSLIAESSSVPVYGTWDFSLGYGIVGGKLTSGYTEGERGANLALRVLNGEDPHTLPVEKQTQSRYMFDFAVMQKWGIAGTALPKDSTVINRPVSFYEENKTLVWGVSIGFILLLFIIAFLVINNNQRRLAQKELAHSNEELRTLQVSLEERVEDRTKALSSVAEVSIAASTILETDKLLQQVVDLAKERFGFYHAHIYLLDEPRTSLVLSSGAGAIGRQMVARGHSIPLDREQSLVARAGREKKGVTVNDVTSESGFLPNPLLPETRAELAVPMMVGDEVIGVFDVQSETVGRFTDADIAVQTTLAAQVASAVQNAKSYSEVQRSQAQLSEALDIAKLANWEYDVTRDRFIFNDHFYSIFHTTAELEGGYELTSAQYAERLVHPDDLPVVGAAIEKALNSTDKHYSTQLEHRILYRDGSGMGYISVAVHIERDDQGNILRYYGANQDITERKVLQEQLAQRARKQEAINLITQRIQAASTIEEAMQVTARELGHALGQKPTLVAVNAASLAGENKAVVKE